MESHAIKLSIKGNWEKNVTKSNIPATAKILYACSWKAGLLRFLNIEIYKSKSMIYLYINEIGKEKILTIENSPENLKKIWTAKRGIVRNFKKKESQWTTPSLIKEKYINDNEPVLVKPKYESRGRNSNN